MTRSVDCIDEPLSVVHMHSKVKVAEPRSQGHCAATKGLGSTTHGHPDS